MAAVANASSAADGLPALRTPQDLARDYAAFTHCDPLQDCVIAELGGDMVGYSRCWHLELTDGLVLHVQIAFVPGQWRQHGIDSLLLAWAEQRHRTVAAQEPGRQHVHHAYLRQEEETQALLLHAHGYVPVRYFEAMLHTQLHAVPDFPLPAGIELRPVLPAHYRAIWNAHHTAFLDHWGMARPGPGDFEAWQQSRVFQPDRWQVAWSGDEVAGQVRTYIDEDQNRLLARRRGYSEFISVGRPWRRLGLARALIARSLQLLAREGMQESALEVDSHNPTGATRVYADCGFVVDTRGTVYRKALEV